MLVAIRRLLVVGFTLLSLCGAARAQTPLTQAQIQTLINNNTPINWQVGLSGLALQQILTDLNQAASLIARGSSPTLTTGSCSGSSAVGGATAGTFTAASCVAGTYILSALPSAPTGYACTAQDRTTTADTLIQSATTATSATFKATTAASDVIQFQCMAY